MPLELHLVAALGFAVAVVYWSTPVAIRVAERFGFLDTPTGGYKDHVRPTPYLGGASVTVGFVLGALLFVADSRTLPLVAGALVLWLVGTLDDRRSLSWWSRVAIEAALAAALWSVDLGWQIGLPAIVELVLTIGWIVAVVNAFNIFDNMDGVAGTTAGIAAGGIALLGLAADDAWLAVSGAALCGACIGFLPHNLSSPARIFLGDGGSMPVGFLLAALAIAGGQQVDSAWLSLTIGLMLVAVPSVDCGLRVVARRRAGVSPLTGGRDGLAHLTKHRVGTAGLVALGLGCMQAVLSALAVGAVSSWPAYVTPIGVAFLVGSGAAIVALDVRERNQSASRRLSPPHWLNPVPHARCLGVAAIGMAAGASPFVHGLYDSSSWAPIGLGVVALLIAVAVARPMRLTGPALSACVLLTGLALLATSSAAWADSIQQALVDANRLIVYAALLALLLLLVRDSRTALWGLGGFTLGGLAVAATQLMTMLFGDATDMYLLGRLDDPLGYINGQGAYAAMALWPLLALTEQRRSASLAGAAMTCLVLLGGLAMLSESRGVALAVVLTALVVLAAVPGRGRRISAMSIVAAALALASPELIRLYESGVDEALAVADTRSAAATLLLVAVAAGLVWAGGVALLRRLDQARPAAAVAVRRTAAIAGMLAVAIATVGTVAAAGSIRDEVDRQYEAFVRLARPPGDESTGSRLLSGAGNRHDYWSVALRLWEVNPVLGVGAGNYVEPYLRQRQTVEEVRQPHSLLLQTLSELGLVGALVLLGMAAAIVVAVVRQRARAAVFALDRGLLVAALGSLGVWTVHTQVDWLHLLPGLTASALLATAVLLRPGSGSGAPTGGSPRTRSTTRTLGVAAALLLLLGAGLSLSRQILAEHYRGEAQAALPERPREALNQAERALRLDGEDLSAYYTKAAALARLRDANGAQAALHEAHRREPRDFLPLALLGDIARRREDPASARAYYVAALRLNPREPALAELARATRRPERP